MKRCRPTWPQQWSTRDSCSPITERELDYLEELVKAYDPPRSKDLYRFIAISRARMQGMTFYEIGRKIGLLSLEGHHFRAYGNLAARFLYQRSLHWETDPAAPLFKLKRMMIEQVTPVENRIRYLQLQLRQNRKKLRAIRAAYPFLKKMLPR